MMCYSALASKALFSNSYLTINDLFQITLKNFGVGVLAADIKQLGEKQLNPFLKVKTVLKIGKSGVIDVCRAEE